MSCVYEAEVQKQRNVDSTSIQTEETTNKQEVQVQEVQVAENYLSITLQQARQMPAHFIFNKLSFSDISSDTLATFLTSKLCTEPLSDVTPALFLCSTFPVTHCYLKSKKNYCKTSSFTKRAVCPAAG